VSFAAFVQMSFSSHPRVLVEGQYDTDAFASAQAHEIGGIHYEHRAHACIAGRRDEARATVRGLSLRAATNGFVHKITSSYTIPTG